MFYQTWCNSVALQVGFQKGIKTNLEHGDDGIQTSEDKRLSSHWPRTSRRTGRGGEWGWRAQTLFYEYHFSQRWRPGIMFVTQWLWEPHREWTAHHLYSLLNIPVMLKTYSVHACYPASSIHTTYWCIQTLTRLLDSLNCRQDPVWDNAFPGSLVRYTQTSGALPRWPAPHHPNMGSSLWHAQDRLLRTLCLPSHWVVGLYSSLQVWKWQRPAQTMLPASEACRRQRVALSSR